MKRALLACVMLWLALSATEASAAGGAVNVNSFGALPNDNKLDTTAIQSAIDLVAGQGGGTVEVPAGKYDVAVNSGGTALALKSNVHLKLDKDAVLELKPTSLGIYRLLYVGSNVSNVTISGGTLVGERNGHTGKGGEWGHGIQFYGNASNVEISDMTLKNFWGDGIEIGSPDANVPQGIRITKVISDNNRRQGLSIVAGKDIAVTNSVFKNTNGTGPAAGIDLERDKPYNLPLENVVIESNIMENNAGNGLSFVYTDSDTISAKHNVIRDNKEGGVYFGHANKATVAENVIVNNGAGIAKDPTFGSGVWLNFSAGNKVLANEISGSYRNGVHAVNGVNNNEIRGNKITGNKVGAINVYNGQNLVIADNHISANGNDNVILGAATATQSNNGSNVVFNPVPTPDPSPEPVNFYAKLFEVVTKLNAIYSTDKAAAIAKLERILDVIAE